MPATITPPKLLGSYSVYTAMDSVLIAAFEPNDSRFTNWVRSSTISASATVPAITYYFPNKYNSSVLGSQFDVILRLGEIYLIMTAAAQWKGTTWSSYIRVIFNSYAHTIR